MKKIASVLFCILLACYSNTVLSQAPPSTCFEITRFFVDACPPSGGPEGANEMMYFNIGPADLHVGSLVVTWYSNSFTGICQDASTAATVASLNAQVLTCGYLKEPIGGVLPAGSKCVLMTSTYYDPTYFSFANLTDTLIVIFQCGIDPNVSGHFRNYSACNCSRWAIMNFGGGCADTATYVVDSLIDHLGNHTAENGAGVDFGYPPTNSITYTFYGCQQPLNPLHFSLSSSAATVCPGNTVNVSSSISGGSPHSMLWYGGHGTFTNPNNTSTSYQTNSLYLGMDSLIFYAVGTCNDTLRDTLFINMVNAASIGITASGPTTFCNGGSVLLTATGASGYQWTPGTNTDTLTVTTTGVYTVTGTGSCGTGIATQTVTVISPTPVSISSGSTTTFCQGDSILLTANGTGSYSWSTGATTSSTYATATGSYSVTLTNVCGTTNASIDVSVIPSIPVSIQVVGASSFCEGGSALLIASGGSPYLWAGGATEDTILVTQAGHYSVQGNSICSTDNASVDITVLHKPALLISQSSPVLCKNGNVNLVAKGADTYLWSTTETKDTIQINQPGIYSVQGTNTCGSVEKSVDVPLSLVTASFSAPLYSGYAPFLTALTNESSHSSSYLWNFGDSAHSTDLNPSHTFLQPGKYVVRLQSTDTSGCIASDEHLFEINGNDSIKTPNIFSPNGDGLNDEFTITGADISEMQAKIFNRWGKEIFSWDKVDQGWDGKTKSGNVCSDGVYMYIIKVKLNSGSEEIHRGTVTLVH